MYKTISEKDTASFGAALASVLKKGDTVLLTGDLGAGKSVLARGIARAFGVTGPMASPTFTLMQPYEGTEKIYHFDLYRLSDEDELYAAGLDECIGTDGIALIEWPMEDMPVASCVKCALTREKDAETRHIQIATEAFSDRDEALRAALKQWEDRA